MTWNRWLALSCCSESEVKARCGTVRGGAGWYFVKGTFFRNERRVASRIGARGQGDLEREVGGRQLAGIDASASVDVRVRSTIELIHQMATTRTRREDFRSECTRFATREPLIPRSSLTRCSMSLHGLFLVLNDTKSLILHSSRSECAGSKFGCLSHGRGFTISRLLGAGARADRFRTQCFSRTDGTLELREAGMGERR